MQSLLLYYLCLSNMYNQTGFYIVNSMSTSFSESCLEASDQAVVYSVCKDLFTYKVFKWALFKIIFVYIKTTTSRSNMFLLCKFCWCVEPFIFSICTEYICCSMTGCLIGRSQCKGFNLWKASYKIIWGYFAQVMFCLFYVPRGGSGSWLWKESSYTYQKESFSWKWTGNQVMYSSKVKCL